MTATLPRVRFTLFVAWTCLVAAAARAGEFLFRLPEGFAIERVAGPPEVAFPMFAAFDDRGRLFVAESSGLDLYEALQNLSRKCRVSVLEDADGDGRYERSRVFVEGLVCPMGLAWRDGRLYVCDPPHVVAYEERDGRAGPREVVLGTFGHVDNGSLHGLCFGPDGLLHGTLGSPDGYRIERSDGGAIAGTSGMAFRCRPDGAHPEVLAHGFTNLVELAFMPGGEIIGTNNWYQLPADGLRDSLLHVVEGGFYPGTEEKGTGLPARTGRLLPAMTMLPAAACSGMCRLRSRTPPREHHDNLFVAQFNLRNVTRHAVSRAGATFRTDDAVFLATDDPDFRPSDVLEDADGSLLVVDTGSWYVQHCPTGGIRGSPAQGGIYRVRHTAAARPADPWGLRIDWRAATAGALAALLADPRPAVRDRAQATLVQRGGDAVAAVAAVLDGTRPAAESDTAETPGQMAVWTLAGIGDEAALARLRTAAAGPDAELAAAATRALGRRRDGRSAPVLRPLLGHPALHVRLAAAEAVARCGDAAATPDLLAALAAGPDATLEHMLVRALAAVADRPALAAALAHPSPRVQRAALVLLDQPPHESLAAADVVRRADAADADLRQAARAILESRPEWGDHAAALLRRRIEAADLPDAEAEELRRSVLALQRHAAVAAMVAAAIGGPPDALPDARRILLLEAVAAGTAATLPEELVTALGRALGHPAATVRRQAVRTAAAVGAPALDAPLARIADDPGQPADVRVEAARALVRRRPDVSPARFALLAGELDPARDPLARLAAAQVLGEARLTDGQFRRLLDGIRRDPLVSPAVPLAVFARSAVAEAAAEFVDYLVEAAGLGWSLPEEPLRGVVAALPEPRREEAVRRLAAARHTRDDQAAAVGDYLPLAAGGDAERGRALFFGKATCSGCHRVGAAGGVIGPDLTRIGAVRSARDLVESLVVPSATIAQRYETYVAVTDAGRAVTGVLVRQTDELLVLRDAAGAEVRIPRAEIEELQTSRRSLMPETTIRLLDREEARDLFAYLQGLE